MVLVRAKRRMYATLEGRKETARRVDDILRSLTGSAGGVEEGPTGGEVGLGWISGAMTRRDGQIGLG